MTLEIAQEMSSVYKLQSEVMEIQGSEADKHSIQRLVACKSDEVEVFLSAQTGAAKSVLIFFSGSALSIMLEPSQMSSPVSFIGSSTDVGSSVEHSLGH
mmetsp:Transcript_14820/g.40969  ORF Transcript_14820/g.40969 Transcript_14820/m.40969 type:complete len:99 (+) Transcript_14820:419-715(+)